MNLTSLMSTARTRFGAPSGDSFYTDAVLTALVNEALDAVSLEFDWPWLQGSATITTAAADRDYAVPADWIRTRKLYIANNEPLELVPSSDVLWSTAQGRPTQYAIEGDLVQLFPVPDGVYSVTHKYTKSEPDLSTGSDTPLMPAVFHHAIVALVVNLMHVRAGNLTKANAALVDYRAWLTRMQDHRRRSSATLRPRVRPGGWM